MQSVTHHGVTLWIVFKIEDLNSNSPFYRRWTVNPRDPSCKSSANSFQANWALLSAGRLRRHTPTWIRLSSSSLLFLSSSSCFLFSSISAFLQRRKKKQRWGQKSGKKAKHIWKKSKTSEKRRQRGTESAALLCVFTVMLSALRRWWITHKYSDLNVISEIFAVWHQLPLVLFVSRRIRAAVLAFILTL